MMMMMNFEFDGIIIINIPMTVMKKEIPCYSYELSLRGFNQ